MAFLEKYFSEKTIKKFGLTKEQTEELEKNFAEIEKENQQQKEK